MAKKNILHDREATENLGYIIKLIVGAIIILGAVLYMIFGLKPTYDQIKEIITLIAVYLMGYGTQRFVKKNGK
jgi:hypothetical protein